MNPELEPNRNDSEMPRSWRARQFTLQDLINKVKEWIKDQIPLFEAFWVALTFHVLLFPLLWFMGWALPWPHAPNKITVIEIDLQEWARGQGVNVPPKKIKNLFQVPMSKGPI